ncbi:MAG: glycosyltransferase family 4 protein, partial [Alphaproteobacteria bacterium]
MVDTWFAVPGDLTAPTGGYVYARRVLAELPALGFRAQVVPLSAEFPNPSATALEDCARRLRALPPDSTVLFDGLAYGAIPAALLDTLHLDVVALVHHPLALETGLDPVRGEELRESERAALARARAVICTSPHTGETLAADYGVAAAKLRLALPGCDPAPPATGGNNPPVLLTVGAVIPRKGHDVLVGALARLRDLPWRSVVVGSLDRAPATVRALERQIARAGLADRIALAGALDDVALAAAYHGADAFVLPSRYEGYGMVFAEALAHGLPVVACRAAAAVDTVPADTGILVDIDDDVALAKALRSLLTDSSLRRTLASAAHRLAA